MKLLKWKKRIVIPVLCGLLLAGVVAGAWGVLRKTEPQDLVVSGGLQQLADGAYLANAAVAGQEITFTPEWFDNALGGTAVTAVSVTALPPLTEGKLLLGHGDIVPGQSIPRETLSYLRFIPNDGVKNSSFSFVPSLAEGEMGYALTCQLRVTDAVNCCPTGTKAVTAVSTHEALTLSGTLVAKDPEGDALYFEICNYPQNGVISLDSTTGAFSYTPSAGYVGADAFTWRVQDANGAYTEEAAVAITVRALETGYTYTDMEGLADHTHALRCSEAGLLAGEKIGGKHYFHPRHGLTRAAFVTVLLKAAEVELPEGDDATGYADDAEIPAGMRGAIRYAREKGWLEESECFRPNDVITRAEAAKIAAAVLGLSAPGYHETVADFSAIPVDAADAMYAIYEGGYITTLADGTLSPGGELTRSDAAKFFARILDGNESDGK